MSKNRKSDKQEIKRTLLIALLVSLSDNLLQFAFGLLEKLIEKLLE